MERDTLREGVPDRRNLIASWWVHSIHRRQWWLACGGDATSSQITLDTCYNLTTAYIDWSHWRRGARGSIYIVLRDIIEMTELSRVGRLSVLRRLICIIFCSLSLGQNRPNSNSNIINMVGVCLLAFFLLFRLELRNGFSEVWTTPASNYPEDTGYAYSCLSLRTWGHAVLISLHHY